MAVKSKKKYGIWDGIVVSTIEGRNEARSGPSHLHEVGENGMKQRNGRESTFTSWLRLRTCAEAIWDYNGPDKVKYILEGNRKKAKDKF